MLLETVKMYLRGQGVNPHERQRINEEKRIQTADTVRSRLKGFKRWAFIKALNWGQSMAEVREDALAEIGLGYPILRAMLHELGNRFFTAGTIAQADDIYWLEKDEVETYVRKLEHNEPLDILSARVEERKAFNTKVQKEIPPPMMPMKKKYMGIDTSVWLAESESNRTGNIVKGVPAYCAVLKTSTKCAQARCSSQEPPPQRGLRSSRWRPQSSPTLEVRSVTEASSRVSMESPL
jgi:pyruvate,water dikinase